MRFRRLVLRLILTSCFMLLAGSFARAQIVNVNNATSTPVPGIGHDYVKMLNETVNPANGSVSLRGQVPVLPGRKLTVAFAFSYDSNGVNTPFLSNSGGVGMQATVQYLLLDGWSYSLPLASHFDTVVTQKPLCPASTGYVFQDSAGSRYPFSLVGYVRPAPNCPPRYNTINASADFYNANLLTTSTGNGYDKAWNVSDLHGTTYSFPGTGVMPPNGTTNVQSSLPNVIEDRNGNKVTFSYGSSCYCLSSAYPLVGEGHLEAEVAVEVAEAGGQLLV